ncbi:MAG TPA: peptidoglycan bridge formation protein FemAB [Spirochaetaceae bacterium]|nr:peptidoglycan bridge formation protein FemAB [Spirochaetaceae bacterium]
MNIRIRPKPPAELASTRLLQQTALWGRIKRKLGWKPLSFDLEFEGKPAGDILVLLRELGDGASIAYVPFGPEELPDHNRRGPYLALLSADLHALLGQGCIFVRWDLPWLSPYAEEDDYFDEKGYWLGPPEPRLRELRMNWGVAEVGLRKAPSDILPPDTMIVDLQGDDDELLKRMKPKTRYNIRLAERRSVKVREGRAEDLPAWNALYAASARRNRIQAHKPDYFDSLPGQRAKDANIRLLLAEKEGKPLAALFLSTAADGASYLYGASADEDRNHMASYALQWAAMKSARDSGCAAYDMFGVAPRPDPSHPMYGLYLFKAGFGGRLIHRQGAWDYPYDEGAYQNWLAGEANAPGYSL